MSGAPIGLPVDAVLGDLADALCAARTAVLVAPPGAGKTTRVPIALLDAEWLAGQSVIVLEPRRIAARAAAQRMATLRGERLGETIGLRTRFETRVGTKTRIEVVTEGVFTRMILADPALTGIGAVIFDEFHERSLDADLGLALAIDARAGLREDLRIVVMSATISGARVAGLLGGAAVVESAGRMYPVETRYLGRDPVARLEDQMAQAIATAMRADQGSLLAFLPGQGEIRRTMERLSERLTDPAIILAPLYGAMDPAAQDLAIIPAPTGRRKVVLATSIAETSLTIEDVRIVVDSGLTRVPRFEPGAGITRLETIRASIASIDQRRGRAGRTAPGICYRLWDEPQTRSLPEFAEPEIRAADLSGLLLDCADWGATDPTALRWLDPPPQAAVTSARESLVGLGALDHRGHITAFGRTLRRLPLPPRLAGMVAHAANEGAAAARDAAEIAALLVERGLGGPSVDLQDRLERFRREKSPRARQMRELAANWARLALRSTDGPTLRPAKRQAERGEPATGTSISSCPSRPAQADAIAGHLMTAFPDRIAKARGKAGQFILASGRGAHLDVSEPLSRAQFLIVAELQGAAVATRILSAAPATEADIHASAAGRIERLNDVDYDPSTESVRARSIVRLGAITLQATPQTLDGIDGDLIRDRLAAGLAQRGIEKLPWSKSHRQLRQRLAFVRAAGEAAILDLGDETLAATATHWLAPFLAGKSRASQVTAGDLDAALQVLIPWSVRQHLDDAAPTHYLAPTGERHPIDYDGAGAPALHIRVQELFGLSRHPSIAGGRLPLTLYLLSPAHRPIQITRDLPGFWAGSWSAVKSEMKGRYPRHVWPDDPANTDPTRRAKPRGT